MFFYPANFFFAGIINCQSNKIDGGEDDDGCDDEKDAPKPGDFL